MPSINMIAARREEKRRLERNTRHLVYGIGGELAAIIVFGAVLTTHLMTINGQIEELHGQVAQLQPKVNKINEIDNIIAKLKPRVTILNEARNTTLYWYTALETIAECLPHQTWVTTIATTGDPTPPAPTPPGQTASSSPSAPSAPGLTFSGMAPSSEQVGAAMMNMNGRANINGVTIAGVNQTQYAGQNAMSFDMTVQLKANIAQDVTTPGFENPPAQSAPASGNAAADLHQAGLSTTNTAPATATGAPGVTSHV